MKPSRSMIRTVIFALVCTAVSRTTIAGADPAPTLTVGFRIPLVEPAPKDWKPRERAGMVLSASGRWLFVGSASGLHAIDTQQRSVSWSFRSGEAIDATPVLSGSRVFAATVAGDVHAFDARSGRSLWAQPARLEAVVRAPLATDSRHVYVAADPGSLSALEVDSGRPAWRFRTEAVREFLVAGQSGATVIGDLVLAGMPDGRLVALGARDGGVTWDVVLEKRGLSPYGDVDATPVHVRRGPHAAKRSAADGGDWVLTTSHSGGLYALSAADGTILWQADGEAFGRPVVVDDRVYVASAQGELDVFDLATGRRIWGRTFLGHPEGLAVLTGRRFLAVACEAGLDVVSAATGRAVARYLSGHGFAAAPAVVGSRIYVVSNGGILYGLDTRTPSSDTTGFAL